jgi:hypothetical protein
VISPDGAAFVLGLVFGGMGGAGVVIFALSRPRA